MTPLMKFRRETAPGATLPVTCSSAIAGSPVRSASVRRSPALPKSVSGYEDTLLVGRLRQQKPAAIQTIARAGRLPEARRSLLGVAPRGIGFLAETIIRNTRKFQ